MTTSASYLKYEQPGIPGKQPTLVQYVLDFSVTNVVQDTIYQIWQCPEDYVVFSCGYEILTASTDAADCEVGKAGGTEMLDFGIDQTAGTKGAGSLANPLFFKDSDTIDVQLVDASVTTGKIRLWWVGCDVTELNTINDLA
jgi:hypothetical protein